jgi:hypothetical protein
MNTPTAPTNFALAALALLLAAPAMTQAPKTSSDLQRARDLFAKVDRNGDGLVTALEAGRNKIPSREFVAYDADRDRKLSPAEFTLFYRQLLLKAGRDVDAELKAEASRIAAERRTKKEQEAERAAAAREARQAEQARVEAARVEAARVEAARVEAARVEAARVEAARVEAARVEAARVEAARVEAARVEAARVEAARVEAARVEAARVEAARPKAGGGDAAQGTDPKPKVAPPAGGKTTQSTQGPTEAQRAEQARADKQASDAARAEQARADKARADKARADKAQAQLAQDEEARTKKLAEDARRAELARKQDQGSSGSTPLTEEERAASYVKRLVGDQRLTVAQARDFYVVLTADSKGTQKAGLREALTRAKNRVGAFVISGALTSEEGRQLTAALDARAKAAAPVTEPRGGSQGARRREADPAPQQKRGADRAKGSAATKRSSDPKDAGTKRASKPKDAGTKRASKPKDAGPVRRKPKTTGSGKRGGDGNS